MTKEQALQKANDWLNRIKSREYKTEHIEHVREHIEILEKLIEMAGANNGHIN